jgi:hypothetical protein
MNVQLYPYSLECPVLQGGDVERGERRSPCAGGPIIPSLVSARVFGILP